MHNFPHHNMSSTSYQQTYIRSHPSLHSLRRKSPNSSFPVILLVRYPVPSHLLQAISPAVVPALSHIVNTSLYTGVLPSAFRQARITPLLKKPTLNPTLLGNYKSVCLLPFVGKNTWTSSVQPSLCLSLTELPTVISLVSEVNIQPRLPCSQLLKP